MLEMRPDCESCGADLPADKKGAFICSFECSFCKNCKDNIHNGICPNCSGELVERPMRFGNVLIEFPASQVRKYSI